MIDRNSTSPSSRTETPRAGVEASARSLGFPEVHVGSIVVGPGEEAWRRAL